MMLLTPLVIAVTEPTISREELQERLRLAADTDLFYELSGFLNKEVQGRLLIEQGPLVLPYPEGLLLPIEE